MKYQNSKDILPPELIAGIQQYFQGGYLYIPRASGEAVTASRPTVYKTELAKRNCHIYEKHLEGWSTRRLAEHYSLSPSSIRRILLVKRKDAIKMGTIIQKALAPWDLEGAPLKQQSENVWEIGGRYMLKVYTDEEALRRNAEILSSLRENGVPAAPVIPTGTGEPYAACDGQFFLLTGKLEGRSFTGAVGTGTGRRMGQAIARLHLAFARIEEQLNLWDNSLLGEMGGWIRETLEQSGWQYITEEEFGRVYTSLSRLYPRLPVQMIHRDVHMGNFLFSGETFSGYLDFDLTQRNIRVFDLCYFLAGLLADETGTTLAAPWPEIVRATIAGYERLLPLSPEEKKAIPLVMECIEILFAAYFLSIQDTACAEDAIRVLRSIRQQAQYI